MCVFSVFDSSLEDWIQEQLLSAECQSGRNRVPLLESLLYDQMEDLYPGVHSSSMPQSRSKDKIVSELQSVPLSVFPVQL